MMHWQHMLRFARKKIFMHKIEKIIIPDPKHTTVKVVDAEEVKKSGVRLRKIKGLRIVGKYISFE